MFEVRSISPRAIAVDTSLPTIAKRAHPVQHSLALLDCTPIASGMKRVVYRHPHDPAMIVKIVRADARGTATAKRKPWYKRLRRNHLYRDHVRELEEVLCVSAAHPGGNPPLPRLLGWVETDLGLGLLSRAEFDEHGRIAPTLQQVLQSGGNLETIAGLLAALLDGLLEYGIIVNDLNPANVVVAHCAPHGTRLVLVDGFGEWNFIPRCSLSPRFNAYNTRRRFAALLAQLGIASSASKVRAHQTA